jgi:hypothetical protein
MKTEIKYKQMGRSIGIGTPWDTLRPAGTIFIHIFKVLSSEMAPAEIRFI